MKILKVFLFTLISIMAFSQEDYSLNFNLTNYTKKSFEINGKSVNYRAYEKIVYVKNPVDIEYQNMNIYIPEEYFNGKTVGDFSAENAPIFFPNMVGGYMPGNAGKPEIDDRTGKENAIIVALSKGYVVAAPAVRGRTLTDINGNFTGKAPAAIVDLKAAVRYLRYNDKVMPGNAEKIVSNGTSAGGALSSLLGSTGNNKDYFPYLEELGAANTRDDIFAASVYCPITNLENADIAYEWLLNGVNTYTTIIITKDTNSEEYNDRSIKRERVEGKLTADEKVLSNELKTYFPAYLNSLKLKDKNGKSLSLDKNGNGSFKEYLTEIIKISLEKALEKGLDLSNKNFVKIENGKVISLDFDGYIHSENRMKTPPAFDTLNLSSDENNLFGTKTVDNQHFTKFSSEKGDGSMAEEILIKMMNPMNYINQYGNGIAKYWRIRHGASDKDTALAIPAILALKLENVGKNVDFAAPWEQGHGGDYDLEELFEWIDNIVK